MLPSAILKEMPTDFENVVSFAEGACAPFKSARGAIVVAHTHARLGLCLSLAARICDFQKSMLTPTRPGPRAGSLGMQVGRCEGEFASSIQHFNTNEDGTTGQAEAAGCLHVGDVLVAVEGASLRGVPFQQILATIRAAPRYSPARPARRVARLIYLSAPSSCHCSTWHAIFCWVSELCLAQAIVPDLRDPEGQSGCGRGCGRGCQSGCGRPPQFHEEIDHGRGCRHRRLVRRSLQPPE